MENETKNDSRLGTMALMIAALLLPFLLAYLLAAWGVAFAAWHWMMAQLLGV